MAKPDRMRFAAPQQAGLVQKREAGKQHRVDAPGDRLVAAVPERDPGKKYDKQPEDRCLGEAGSCGEGVERGRRGAAPRWIDTRRIDTRRIDTGRISIYTRRRG